jgi:hypothetical protein
MTGLRRRWFAQKPDFWAPRCLAHADQESRHIRRADRRSEHFSCRLHPRGRLARKMISDESHTAEPTSAFRF